VLRQRRFWIIVAVLCATSSCANGGGVDDEQRVKPWHGKVSVKVPKIVRENIVHEAVEFCHAVYPEVPEQWFLEQFAKYLGQQEWEMNNTPSGSRVKLEAIVSLYLSFPEASQWRWVRCFDPEALPNSHQQQLSLDAAYKKAEGVLVRIIPDDRSRKSYQLHRKADYGEYLIYWHSRPVVGFREANSVGIHIQPDNGGIGMGSHTIHIPDVLKQKVVPRKRIEHFGLEGWPYFKPQDLNLLLVRYLGHEYLCWEYLRRDPPKIQYYTWWDATTGEVVHSNQIDKEGNPISRDKEYWNPKYYPYRTKEEVVKRLEELALQRAKELEEQKKKKEAEKDNAPAEEKPVPPGKPAAKKSGALPAKPAGDVPAPADKSTIPRPCGGRWRRRT